MTLLAFAWSWELDGWIVVAGVLCAVAAALPGNFLVLRRMSMLGDAISHAVLPGLAAAFLISQSRSSAVMFLGAVAVGILTAVATEWISRAGKVDEGASLGVVFTALFALGLVMIVQAADHVDLDPGCVLYGAIEFTPLDRVSLAGFEIPRAVVTLAIVALVNAGFVFFFFKELKISSFDPALATTVGMRARAMHYGLMVVVAVTAVASFELVGNILVVAMLVVPPATAYLLTARLGPMILLSVLLAAVSAVSGHLAAIIVPRWFGYSSTTIAGMMATSAGALLMLAVLFSPREGIVFRCARHQLLSWRILADDVIALLYRMEEREPGARADLASIGDILLARASSLRLVLRWLRWRHQVDVEAHGYRLLPEGAERARRLVRSHRLWEQYLASFAHLDAERLHGHAEQWEHFTDERLRERLSAATDAPTIDPHGRPIPDEHVSD